MKQRGGVRPGAGRKIGSINKKTIVEAEARGILVSRLLTQWQTIADVTLDLALGKMEYVNIDGKRIHAYTRLPDTKMLQTIIELVIGKPKQTIDGNVNIPELQQLATDIRSILTNK